MKTIAMVHDKGGVGKTTTTACLAIVAAKAGRRVVVIDASSQASLHGRWYADTRVDRDAWPFKVVHNARPNVDDTAARLEGLDLADLVLIDTPPEANKPAQVAARVADLILVPCSPAVMDIAQLDRTRVDLLSGARAAPWVVLNKVQLGTNAYEFAKERVAERGIPLCPHAIPLRQRLSEWPYGPPPLTRWHTFLWEWIVEQPGMVGE